MKKVVITGAAGFIGYHLVARLLESGWEVVGVDNLSPYYDVRLKEKRLALLAEHAAFRLVQLDVCDHERFLALVQGERPDELVHLAAQAGVRYSLQNPWAYAQANYTGTLSVFEAVRACGLPRVVYASSSSVYGANTKQPFSEDDRVDMPVSLYAATKRANELLAHTYHHLFGFETVGLRFFTVYGSWGRPDMAYFSFVKKILRGETIDLFNEGKAKRSFTHIDDVTRGIVALFERAPSVRNDIYNIGGSEAVPLTRFVEIIEKELGVGAKKHFLPLQLGDVAETVADCAHAEHDLGYQPQVSIEEGIKKFVVWFRENEHFLLSLKEPLQQGAQKVGITLPLDA